MLLGGIALIDDNDVVRVPLRMMMIFVVIDAVVVLMPVSDTEAVHLIDISTV